VTHDEQQCDELILRQARELDTLRSAQQRLVHEVALLRNAVVHAEVGFMNAYALVPPTTPLQPSEQRQLADYLSKWAAHLRRVRDGEARV
jgi:hypothetical protein